jgi:Rrf2 family protein
MINKSSLLAIKALAELSRLPPGEYAGAARIAGVIDAPANYLGKILQSMASGGLIISQKGNGGGFRLDRNPADIFLYDIVRQIEDVEKWSKCFLGKRQCRDESPCCVHNKWKKVRESNVAFLKSVSLNDFRGQGR